MPDKKITNAVLINRRLYQKDPESIKDIREEHQVQARSPYDPLGERGTIEMHLLP